MKPSKDKRQLLVKNSIPSSTTNQLKKEKVELRRKKKCLVQDDSEKKRFTKVNNLLFSLWKSKI